MITMAAAGLIAKDVSKVLWGWVREVPLWVWAVAIAAALWWWDRDNQFDAGVAAGGAAENARWVAAQEKADREARAAEEKRDKDAAAITEKSDERAQDAVVETRTETAKAVERVHYVTREILVPAGCPVGLPDSVRDEGRAAVERARRAGSQVRAGTDP